MSLQFESRPNKYAIWSLTRIKPGNWCIWSEHKLKKCKVVLFQIYKNIKEKYCYVSVLSLIWLINEKFETVCNHNCIVSFFRNIASWPRDWAALRNSAAYINYFSWFPLALNAQFVSVLSIYFLYGYCKIHSTQFSKLTFQTQFHSKVQFGYMPLCSVLSKSRAVFKMRMVCCHTTEVAK